MAKEELSFETVMQLLKEYGNEQTKKTLTKHGAKEPFFGVKVQDLKKVQKRVKKDQALAEQLFNSGNSDAMYLAALISEPTSMSKELLYQWAQRAYWYYLSEYAVAWTISESKFTLEIALELIDQPEENLASCGWSVLSNYLALNPDEVIDKILITQLLERIENTIHLQNNRVTYTMNGFVIAVGSFVKELNVRALKSAEKIGKVEVDMNGTACKTPLASEYIQKIVKMDKVGKKKKTVFC